MYKALIVDDEKMIVNSLLLGFPWKENGFEVVATASGGREALALIESLHPDAVITDIKMPGMSGLDMMRACRERAPGTVFVIISGHAEFAFAQKAIELGAAAYCLKPLENEEIASALDKVKSRLTRSDTLRRAQLMRFLDAPCAENAEALLSPCDVSGKIGVGLTLGGAEALAAGVPCVTFPVGDMCALRVFPKGIADLESRAFRASLLSAVTAGALKAFVYDETDAPARFLCERLTDLSDQLFSGFFSPENAPLGRALPSVQQNTAQIDDFAALCNKNRPHEALRALQAMDEKSMVMSGALRVHNLCEALICRLKNLPAPKMLRHGYEIAQMYPGFEDMRAALSRRLQGAGASAADPEHLRNDTLKQIVAEINRDFAQDIPFQALCARYRMNPSYLSQLFKKEMNVTFTGYINRLRLGYAKELLEGTALLVSEISDKAGYENYLTFTKLFKKETGLTPKQYRAGARLTGGRDDAAR